MSDVNPALEDESEECPSCGHPSGVVVGWDTLGDHTLVCKHCKVPLEVEYEENMDMDYWMWLTVASRPPAQS